MSKIIEPVKKIIEYTCSMATRYTRHPEDIGLAIVLMKAIICNDSKFNGTIQVYAPRPEWFRDFQSVIKHAPCRNMNHSYSLAECPDTQLIWIGPKGNFELYSPEADYEHQLNREILARRITVWRIEDWR